MAIEEGFFSISQGGGEWRVSQQNAQRANEASEAKLEKNIKKNICG